ncbi:CDP-alcohol phosphatidyltransferase family protein [Arthrobacter alpinus]|uniref:CDP-alcohol phosphatidyltransferase family protein n=1 Tax=Arthrobacter alpinus TaxID=656366 RepID=UPI0012FE9F64|nr:CDP-alcohol phosphatidyltransferase family protein [Arthrobacter alpinus]
MRTVHHGPAAGFACQVLLLAALAATIGLDSAGWVAGVLYAMAVWALLASALMKRGSGFGPADWVTAFRAVLAGGAAALVADSFYSPIAVPALVALSAGTIVLDALDGKVARRTGTTSELGARFDMEVDAFLIFALSVYAAPRVGGWVLLIGAARYVLVAAGWFLPWLRADAPPRYWNKVVAAGVGIALTIAAAGVLPSPLAAGMLLAALAMLAESFGREALWLWRHRREHSGKVAVPPRVLTVTAAVAVWCVLSAPANLAATTPAALAAIPLEGIVLLGGSLFLPARVLRPFAVAGGLLLAGLLVMKALNTGFESTFGRGFDPANDWYYLGPGAGVLGDSIGQAGAIAIVCLAVAFVALSLFLLPRATLRIVRTAASNRRAWLGPWAVLGAAGLLVAAAGLAWAPGAPMASGGASGFVASQVRQLQRDLADRGAFAEEVSHDPFFETGSGAAGPPTAGGMPGAGGGQDAGGLLSRLRGKDVLFVFVESYGRSAVEGSSFSPGIKGVLTAGTAQLEAAGFASRSAFLSSPTLGGASWLAHSTLQSGVWVNSQQRYNQLLTSGRMTLSGAFHKAGWRTVFDIPSNTTDWPQGKAFYGFDALYDSRNVGYVGPKFSYATMPDQYVLSAFQQLELSPAPRSPVMAELDLVSSHTPWTPLPEAVPWGEVGDGSVFIGMPERGATPESVAGDTVRVHALYGESIEYSLNTVFSFVSAHPDPNLILVVLGDHQPAPEISGGIGGHDVPVSIISADPAVLAGLSPWGWQDGMLPGPDAPVWPMSDFRDNFLAAYSGNATSPDSAAFTEGGKPPMPAAPGDAGAQVPVPQDPG